MPIQITKTGDTGKKNAAKELLETAVLEKNEKKKLIQTLIQQAKVATVDYNSLKLELDSYNIDLPLNPDIMHLGAVTEKFAVAQSALSRVSAIEMLAIDNLSRWKRIHNYMLGYVEDAKSEILLEDAVKEMRVKQQEASVRVRLRSTMEKLSQIEEKLNEAESFLHIVAVKKKDLSSIVTNLSRQVKVIAVEHEATRNL